MKKYFYILVALLVLAGIVWLIVTPGKGGKFDQFAQCLRDKKTLTFFGAFWCPHCQAEKARFGKSAQYLPYVECSTPDGQNQTKVCIDAKVKTYPTWEFADGFSLESATAPHKCTSSPDESSACKANYSPEISSWTVNGLLVSSSTDPVKKDNKWSFDPNSRLLGELELADLAKLTSCVLPQ